MLSQDSAKEVAEMLLRKSDLELISFEPLQTLWAGYGHICALKASSTGKPSSRRLPLVLKYVCPPKKRSTENRDEGHLRKVISYQVEQYFYSHLAPMMPKEIAVALCLNSTDSHNGSSNITALLLTDLREVFPIAGEKRGELSENQVYAAIKWLACFHGFWWRQGDVVSRASLRLPPLEEVERPTGEGDLSTGSIWLNGGYTYLATRKTEYADLASDNESEWSNKLCVPLRPSEATVAERVAQFLSPGPGGNPAISAYQTLVHGDVKSENLFTTNDGNAVAFFDFQYVGLGLGVCDLAKLFTCSVPLEMLSANVEEGSMQPGEEALLRAYMSRLNDESGKQYEWDVLRRHWEIALVDWLRFQASWGFWGNTDWLEARVRNILEDEGWRAWLDSSLR